MINLLRRAGTVVVPGRKRNLNMKEKPINHLIQMHVCASDVVRMIQNNYVMNQLLKDRVGFKMLVEQLEFSRPLVEKNSKKGN